MILFTNGCSWTWGGALESVFAPKFVYDEEKRLSIVWPHHLGKLLNAEKVINLSEGCGSNQRILRTTFDWLINQSSSDLCKTVAVIQLSEFSRYEIYDPTDPVNSFENLHENWIHCKLDYVSGRLLPHPPHPKYLDLDYNQSMVKKVNQRIAETTEIELLYNTITQLHALENMFSRFGIKDFYVWNHNHNWMHWPQTFKTHIFSNFKILNENYDWKYSRFSDTDLHPSVEGHIELANLIYKDMLSRGFKDK
jgi:hypothetical protein